MNHADQKRPGLSQVCIPRWALISSSNEPMALDPIPASGTTVPVPEVCPDDGGEKGNVSDQDRQRKEHDGVLKHPIDLNQSNDGEAQ